MPSVTMFQPAVEPAPAPPPPVTVPSSAAAAATPAERLRELAERMAPTHLLRQTGYRSVAFNGHVLGTACGVDQVLAYWYEINIYQTVLGDYVSDIRLFNKDAGAADLFRVAGHDDLEALQAYLEGYDPCGDLPPMRYDDTPRSAAALTLRAIEVQAEMRRITDHYRTTVGPLLSALSA